ncbi:MAG: SH3 domain-containing protein [Kaiparowitsia implicata GSE-PSE-MK54-09C]|jgi:uncharacterized protein YraI|nr:SH3 domain-containing protein [Kaiparowitsia implicata GSE-PSE-MK54-09C]
METLAFTHIAVDYEDPNSAPKLQLNLEIPSSAWLGVLSTAAVVGTLTTATPEAQAVVGFNDVCPAVGSVQSALVNQGYAVSVDDVFGPSTEAAVINFQRAAGLFADGVVGPATAGAMNLADPADTQSPYAIGQGCGGGGGGGGGGNYFVSTNGSDLLVRSGPGAGFAVIDFISNGSSLSVVEFSGGWALLSGGGWVSGDWISAGGGGGGGGVGGGGGGGPDFATVSTNGSELAVRSGPGVGFPAIDFLPNGTTVGITGSQAGWYSIAGGGWISMDWTVEGGFGGGGGGGGAIGNALVSTGGSPLNVRSGPGVGFPITGDIASGERIEIVETAGGWGRLSPFTSNGGWVSLDWVIF